MEASASRRGFTLVEPAVALSRARLVEELNENDLGTLQALSRAVDAVSSNRPYRSGWPREKTLSFVRDCSGALFDPDVAEAFLRVAARKGGAPLAGAAWSPTPERPSNRLSLEAASAEDPRSLFFGV
jgi:hypothetical protein